MQKPCKLILDTFCEVYDLLKDHADGMFWDLRKHDIVPGAIYLIGRKQTLEHSHLIRKLVEEQTIQVIISNPHEGSSTLVGLCQQAGLIDLVQQKKIWLLGGGDMGPEYQCLQFDSFLPKLLDYKENQLAAEQVDSIYNKTIKPYKFLFLNGRGRRHRQALLARLQPLLTQSIWTNLDPAAGEVRVLPAEYEFDRYQNTQVQTPGYVKYELFNNEWGEIYLEPKPYIDTYFSLVTETVFDYPHSFRTEKIWKPICIGHPWIAVANRGFYQDMHNLGFRTFGHVIDESFDCINDNDARLERIAQIVEDLCQQDLAEFLRECYTICKYNQQHLAEMSIQVRQEFPNRFFQFINE